MVYIENMNERDAKCQVIVSVKIKKLKINFFLESLNFYLFLFLLKNIVDKLLHFVKII